MWLDRVRDSTAPRESHQPTVDDGEQSKIGMMQHVATTFACCMAACAYMMMTLCVC